VESLLSATVKTDRNSKTSLKPEMANSVALHDTETVIGVYEKK